MTASETLIAWAHAISVGNYQEAIILLKTHESHLAGLITPLSQHLEALLVLSRVWAALFGTLENGQKDESSPTQKKYQCSFCGQQEDGKRKLIAGPIDNICNICANEFVHRFSNMK